MAKGKFEDLAPGDFAETSIDGGLAKLVRIWEKSRELDTGGYGSGYLVDIKGISHNTGKGPLVTSCSPWTSTVICMALDPRPYDPTTEYSLTGPFAPVINGGQTPLGRMFNWLHNSQLPKTYLSQKNGKYAAWDPVFKKDFVDHIPALSAIKLPIDEATLMRQTDWDWVNRSSGSLIALNIAKPVDPKKMRRGDMVGLNWHNNGGHAVFVWNVHTNAAGDVDAFQFIGSNSGIGVSISNAGGPDASGCVKQDGRYVKNKPDVFTKILEDEQAYHEYTGWPYMWYGLEGVKKSSVDLTSFGPKDPSHVLFVEAGSGPYTVGSLNVARLNGVTPPEPYLVAGKAPPPAPPVKAPVAKVASKPLPAPDKAAPAPAGSDDAAKKPANPPAADPTEPQGWQIQVELDLRTLHTAKWIDADPGDAGSVNDAASQAAIRDYQVKFMNSKAPALGHADPDTRARLCKAAAFARMMPLVNGYLGMLVKAGQLKTAPGTDPVALDEQTRASVKEFQTQHGLGADGIPGPMTQQKLGDVAASLPPAEPPNAKIPPAVIAAAASPAPDASSDAPNSSTGDAGIALFYWVTNHGAPGQPAKLAIVASPKTEGKALTIGLYNGAVAIDDKIATATIANGQASASVAIPATLAGGTKLTARATGDGGISAQTAEYTIDGAAGAAGSPPATTSADWRSYIGKDSVPDDVIATITKNRAVYPAKTLTLVSGKYAGPLHYDYKPPADYQAWATKYFKAKEDKPANRAFVGMLTHEGFPASFQTYDNQIITWGAGLGAKGNGCHAFEELNKTPAMKKFLDDIGINFEKHYWYVVDTKNKKVVASVTPAKGDKKGLGNDDRHIPPLQAWREQPDLMSAIIGLSEDPNTRVAVGESQYAVYLSNSASWPGQDKIFSDALWFFVSHMFAWRPAYAKYGFDAGKEFAKLGASAPSVDTDVKLAPILANAFVRYASKQLDPKSAAYYDVWDRTRSHMWRDLRTEGKKQSFDPGPLTYDADVPTGVAPAKKSS